MKRVPLWKVKRELARPFRQQLPMLSERMFSWLFGSMYYDLVLSGQVRQFEGSIPVADKVAVYLIFPTNGVTASHITAIRYLGGGGYAPLVMSNLPLTDADRQRLRDISWHCVERPNFGYDFGGYRDGILTAIDKVPDLARLVLVNDSCWFPLPGAKDWLAQAEAMDRDFVGAATNYGHPRVDAMEYRDIAWAYRSTHRNFHYCSFALMMTARVLKHPGFIRFWKDFPLSNRKRHVVRRGEIGLTQWVLKQGFSHGTTHDITDLDKMLAGLTAQELETAARDVIIPEAPRYRELKMRVLANPRDRRDLEALILSTVSDQGSSYALVSFLHRHAGYAFLKKSPVWLDPHASDLTIGFARRLEGRFGKTIVNEALELRRARAPSFDRIDA